MRPAYLERDIRNAYRLAKEKEHARPFYEALWKLDPADRKRILENGYLITQALPNISILSAVELIGKIAVIITEEDQRRNRNAHTQTNRISTGDHKDGFREREQSG